MADLPTHQTRIEKVLVEGPVPAWVGCDLCGGRGKVSQLIPKYPYKDSECPVCKYAGGKWHPDITHKTGASRIELEYPYHGPFVTKSSQLQREWKICPRCENMNHEDSCPDCLNIYGKSTGAVPGSAGPWELVRE